MLLLFLRRLFWGLFGSAILSKSRVTLHRGLAGVNYVVFSTIAPEHY